MKLKRLLIGGFSLLLAIGLVSQMSVAHADADYDKAKANAP